MLLWDQTTESIATAGLETPPVALAPTVSTHMHAAYAKIHPTGLRHVPELELDHSDPRIVITPLSVDKAEDLLRSLGILEDWKHVTSGL